MSCSSFRMYTQGIYTHRLAYMQHILYFTHTHIKTSSKEIKVLAHTSLPLLSSGSRVDFKNSLSLARELDFSKVRRCDLFKVCGVGFNSL